MSDNSTSDPFAGFALLRRIWRSVSVPVVSVILALVIGGIILFFSGANAIAAYSALAEGAFGDARAIGRTLEKATPLILGGLAVAFAFKAQLFNIGGQGQLVLGAIMAAYVGYSITGLPTIFHLPLALLAGCLAGALYGAIPGALKTYTGAHEVITTIMLNSIAINLTEFLADGPWKDPTGIFARTPAIQDSAEIPRIGEVPVGFLIAVAMAGVIWYLLYRTTLGFEIRSVGQNQHAAQYAGIKVSRTIILTMMISGLLAGMGGAIETQGVVGRYQPGFNVGLGFDGITIALLARTHPLAVVPSAILLGAMRAGTSQMQFDARVASEIIDVVQALMLFFVSADMIVRWLIRVKAEEGEKVSLSTGWGQN